MKIVPRGIAVLALASVLFAFSTFARAQNDQESPIVSRAVSATVDYGNDNVFVPAKHAIEFDRLGVQPGTTVTVTVQFPVELAGQLILVDPLDGGSVNVPDEGLFIGNDGTVTFQFQSGSQFGAARVAVHQPDDSNYVKFWVVDPDHPENTPPDLPGIY
jgi:hypothetical protein